MPNSLIPAWSDCELTDAGIAMRQKAIAEKRIIDFPYAEIGQGVPVQPEGIYTMTALILPAHRVAVKRSYSNQTTHHIDVFIDNKEYLEDILCREVGIFAKFEDEENIILYGYAYTMQGAEAISAGSILWRTWRIGVNTHLSRSSSITVSYDGSEVFVPYDVFDATQPTELIATIEHRFDDTPLCVLYRSEGALGTLPYGQGEYGGGGRIDTPYRFRMLPKKMLEVYATPFFAGLGTPEIVWHTKQCCALIFKDSTVNLLVEMRG